MHSAIVPMPGRPEPRARRPAPGCARVALACTRRLAFACARVALACAPLPAWAAPAAPEVPAAIASDQGASDQGASDQGASDQGASDQDAVFEQLMQLLAGRRHGHAEFIEQHFLAVLKRPLESSGELRYDAPDHLEKRTVLPRPELLQVDGPTVTLQRGGRSRVIDLAEHPEIAPFVESMRFTLQGNGAGLRRLFAIELAGTLDRWTLQLSPKDARLAKLVSRIDVDGSGAELRHVEIRQTDGDRSLLTLRPLASP